MLVCVDGRTRTLTGLTDGPATSSPYSAEFKQSVVGECMRPGVSIAAVALHRGLNANMLRKWVIEAEHRLPPKRAVAATAGAGG